MQVVAEGLIRVRDEILAWREGRSRFLTDLERQTRDRRTEVSRTLAQFSKDCAAVAHRTKGEREVFLSSLKRAVTGLRGEVRADLGQVQQAFHGLRSPLGDTFPARTKLRKPAPALSAEVKREARGAEVEPAKGRASEPEGGKQVPGDKKRRASPRRQRR